MTAPSRAIHFEADMLRVLIAVILEDNGKTAKEDLDEALLQVRQKIRMWEELARAAKRAPLTDRPSVKS